MCALFGPSVAVQQAPLELAGGEVHDGGAQVLATVTRLPLPTATSLAHLPAFEPPTGHSLSLEQAAPAVLRGPDMAVVREALTTHGLGGAPFVFAAVSKTVAPDPAPTVVADLSFMLTRALVRRGVGVLRLPETQQIYWTRRLADARRLNPRLIRLVAVFPDLPLEAERPVAYRSEEDAIVYMLPARPVPLSTVVIARHTTSGELLQGRFYRETPDTVLE